MSQSASETIRIGIIAFLACYGFWSLAADIEQYAMGEVACAVGSQ